MLTEAQAKRLGWEVVRVSYRNTCDDRLDRWYLQRTDARIVDRRGPGYVTKKAALEALEMHLRLGEEARADA